MSTNNSAGQARFDFFLNQVTALMEKAAKQKNPALWLYRNNGRTPFFMLEGLARLYASLHNEKKFKKLQERFKLIEDKLGGIDYHEAMANSFAANKKIPAAITTQFKTQFTVEVQQLQALLESENWLNGKRIAKIQEKLAAADWLEAAAELPLIQQHYHQQTAKITAFVDDTAFHFDNMEEDVHELRRKLRWLSIYPQALQGAVQLGNLHPKAKHIAKYLTKAVITSPYNQFPKAAKGQPVLQLDKNYFYSLSWVIAELGMLKDKGLGLHALTIAIMAGGKISEAEAWKQAHQLIGSQQPNLLQLLDQAESICKTFFAEKNLAHLFA